MENPERKSPISRRGFLKLAALAVGGAATYGFWRFNNEYQEDKMYKKMSEWEPRVANLLGETVESQTLDNLKVLSDLARPQFVGIVSASQESLFSPNSKSGKNSKHNLLAFVLGEHYQIKIPSYEEYPNAILRGDESVSFLDRAIDRVGHEKIREADLQNQANMWI